MKISKILALTGITLALINPFFKVRAEENTKKDIPYANVNVVSQYLSGASGNLISSNPSVQTCVGILREDGLNFSIWSDYTLGDKNENAKFTEIDPGIHIPFPENDFVNGNFYGGLFFVPKGNITGEIGANFSPKQNLLGDINTNIYVGQGIFNGENGRVITGSACKKIDLTNKLTAKIKADLSFCNNYGAVNGLSHAGLGGNVTYSFGKGWNANAEFRQQIPIRNDAEDYNVFSVGINKSF